MNLLEQQTRFINLDELTITKSSDSASSGAALRREMKLTLFSYTYRPPGDAREIPEIPAERKGRSTEIPD